MDGRGFLSVCRARKSTSADLASVGPRAVRHRGPDSTASIDARANTDHRAGTMGKATGSN